MPSALVTPPLRGGRSKLARAPADRSSLAGGSAAAVVAADFDPRRAAANGLLMVAEAAANRGAATRPAEASGALALLSLAAEEVPHAPPVASTVEHWRISEAAGTLPALSENGKVLMPVAAGDEPVAPSPPNLRLPVRMLMNY